MAAGIILGAHGTVMVNTRGSLLPVHQLERLAAAPELDLFRPQPARLMWTVRRSCAG